ncbi:MAG: hypothetical protein WA103_02675 [Minisyncoccales bacterium]|jgi:hypothetical protein
MINEKRKEEIRKGTRKCMAGHDNAEQFFEKLTQEEREFATAYSQDLIERTAALLMVLPEKVDRNPTKMMALVRSVFFGEDN